MKAIYYPYSICKKEKTLKIMLLLFERIIFLDNKPYSIRELANELLLDVNNDLLSAYSYAMEQGFISIHNTRQVLEKYDLMITKSIYDDANYQESVHRNYEIFNVIKRSLSEVDIQKNEIIGAYKQVVKKLTLGSAGFLVPVITANISLGADFRTIFISSVAAELGYLTTSGVSNVVDAINKFKASKGNSYS